MGLVNTIRMIFINTIRSVIRWSSRAAVSLFLFLVVRRIFPWPFRSIGMRLTRKYGPGIWQRVRPYAERGVDSVSGIIQQRRGYTMQPVGMDTADALPEM